MKMNLHQYKKRYSSTRQWTTKYSAILLNRTRKSLINWFIFLPKRVRGFYILNRIWVMIDCDIVNQRVILHMSVLLQEDVFLESWTNWDSSSNCLSSTGPIRLSDISRELRRLSRGRSAENNGSGSRISFLAKIK
jgi:hypothetical protein